MNRTEKDGHTYYCKECNRERAKLWGKENPDKRREKYRLWAKNNPDKVKEGRDKWRHNHIDQQRASVKSWQVNYPERFKASSRQNNLKQRSTPKGKLNHCMSTAILRALNGNKCGMPWESLVGYNVDKLMIHIGKQFTQGMSWNNYVKWRIDHKIPISVFNYEKPEDIDFKRCWSLRNLQPLWSFDNISKNDKLENQFQPGLIF